MKTLKVILIGAAIVLTLVCIKYKVAYKVTLSGETIGYVTDKDLMETKINKYINDSKGNIAFRELAGNPGYDLKLIARSEETTEKQVMLAVENATTTTYKFFAVTSDGEQKALVESEDEAENIINGIKEGLNEKIDLKLGITEVYTTEYNVASQEEATAVLNEIKTVAVKNYEEEQAKAKAAAAAAARAKAIRTATSIAATGNISGIPLTIPVSGTITSRFGARSSSRSSAHTGLDIATSSGTPVRAIAPGTVIYAGYKGSYGNLVIIDHGNGIQSYYAHCSAIYVSVGQGVDSNTTISAVGSTGNSTGPHLHLEIRINGSPVNPQNYLY